MFALLAAMAAVVLMQNSPAYADATSLDCVALDGTTDDQPPGTVQTFTPGDQVTCTVTTAAAPTGGVSWNVTGASIDNQTTANAVNNTVEFTVPANSSSITVAYTFTDANGQHPSTQANQTNTLAVQEIITDQDSGTVYNAVGTTHSVTFQLPANIVCQSDNGSDPDATTRACDAADVTSIPPGAVNIVVTATGARNAAGTATVEWAGGQVGSSAVTLALTHLNTADGGTDDEDFEATTNSSKVFAYAELRHVDELGDIIYDQDVPNNVVGKRHDVCVFDDDDNPLQIPLSIGDINVQSGGGYTAVTDPDPTFTDPLVYIGDSGDANGATCFSWVSTEAGDQEINAEYTGDDGEFYQIDWDTDAGRQRWRRFLATAR